MKAYKEAFKDNPYFYMPHEGPLVNGVRLSNPQKPKYRRTLVWRAITPNGKPSKYFHVEHRNDKGENPVHKMAKLKKGYKWEGPFLYTEAKIWIDDPYGNENATHMITDHVKKD